MALVTQRAAAFENKTITVDVTRDSLTGLLTEIHVTNQAKGTLRVEPIDVTRLTKPALLVPGGTEVRQAVLTIDQVALLSLSDGRTRMPLGYAYPWQ